MIVFFLDYGISLGHMLIVLIIVLNCFIAVLNLLLELSQFQDSIHFFFFLYEWSYLSVKHY